MRSKTPIQRLIFEKFAESGPKTAVSSALLWKTIAFSRKKGAVTPYQAGSRLLPRLANAYKLALAKSAYNRFSFFARPLYATFR